MSDSEIESSNSQLSEGDPEPQETTVKVSRPRIKLDAERLLEDQEKGIRKVFLEFPKIDLGAKDQVYTYLSRSLMYYRSLKRFGL